MAAPIVNEIQRSSRAWTHDAEIEKILFDAWVLCTSYFGQVKDNLLHTEPLPAEATDLPDLICEVHHRILPEPHGREGSSPLGKRHQLAGELAPPAALRFAARLHRLHVQEEHAST